MSASSSKGIKCRSAQIDAGKFDTCNPKSSVELSIQVLRFENEGSVDMQDVSIVAVPLSHQYPDGQSLAFAIPFSSHTLIRKDDELEKNSSRHKFSKFNLIK